MIEDVIAWLRLNKRRGLLVFNEAEQKDLKKRYPDVADQIFFEYEIRGKNFEALFIDETVVKTAE